ncbi:MAG: dNTP triphosphohydrolase, partial [Victivallales bacterium]
MLRHIADQYRHEDSDLAPYAIHNMATRGRRHSEEPHAFRTDFQRDRDRILHSRSFRRLEYKTQVFLNGTGDHLRTRLTHTIEVAAISRTLARALYLNEDLSETIALAHDLGHTPFGHSGERGLNELMKSHGGFDHNTQALRVVDELEQKYPEFDGLNLTWEVRTGLIKHRGKNTMIDGVKLTSMPFLEAQISDVADDLTYYGHDVDDGLDAGLITEEMLGELEIWRLAIGKARSRASRGNKERVRAFTVRCLIDMMVGNVILNSNKNIESAKLADPMDAQNLKQQIVAFDPVFEKMTLTLRKFLYNNVYFCESVNKVNDEAVEKMRSLFKAYSANPSLMGRFTKTRINKIGLEHSVADY